MIYRCGRTDSKQFENHIPDEYLKCGSPENSVMYSAWTDSGAFVGCVVFEYEPGTADVLELICWYTVPDFRGMGYGSELMDFALDHLTVVFDPRIECVLPPENEKDGIRGLLEERGFRKNDEKGVYMEYTADQLVNSNLMELAPKFEKSRAFIKTTSGLYSSVYEKDGRVLASLDVAELKDMIYVRRLVINDRENAAVIPGILLDLAEKLKESGATDKKIYLTGKDEAVTNGIRASFGDEEKIVQKTVMNYDAGSSSEDEADAHWFSCRVRDIAESDLYRFAMTERNLLKGINGITFAAKNDSPVNRTTISQVIAGELKSAGADLPDEKNEVGLGRFLVRGDRLEAVLLGRKKEDSGYEIYGYTDINGDDRAGVFLKLLFSQVTAIANYGGLDETLDITVNTSDILLILCREFGSFDE